MERIDVDGLSIAFERAGEGPPVVLVHGGVSDHREWRKQVEALSDAFAVVAWDAPGSGSSDDPPEWFRMPHYADCLAGLVRVLSLDRPHVVGLSFGATLALELYRRHPSVPRSLVLLGGYAGGPGRCRPRSSPSGSPVSSAISRSRRMRSRAGTWRRCLPTRRRPTWPRSFSGSWSTSTRRAR